MRLDAMGDVLMTEPAIRALKESNPNASLTLLASPTGGAVASLLSCIDDTLLFAAPWVKSSPAGRDPRQALALIEELRDRRFDAAVIFTVYSQNPLPAAWLCQLAGIPRRLAHCRENPYHLLTDWVRELEPETIVRHEVRRQLELVGSVSCLTSDERIRVRLTDADKNEARLFLASRGVDVDRPFVVVHSGAAARSRRYPGSGFAQVIREFRAEIEWPVLLTGTDSERDEIEAIRWQAGVPCENLAGAMPLALLAAVLERAALLISNNTGVVHLAAGVGTPTVDLYALTNPQHTPWKVSSRVLFHDVSCRYCYKSVCPEKHNKCLTSIDPSDVVNAALDLCEEIGLHRVDVSRRWFDRRLEELPRLRLPAVQPPLPSLTRPV